MYTFCVKIAGLHFTSENEFFSFIFSVFFSRALLISELIKMLWAEYGYVQNGKFIEFFSHYSSNARIKFSFCCGAHVINLISVGNATKYYKKAQIIKRTKYELDVYVKIRMQQKLSIKNH